MPTKHEIYNIWAPRDAVWSGWVKPVLYSFMDGVFENPSLQPVKLDLNWVPPAGSAGIVLDLPGADGVIWGIQLARSGYRPVPLYNALPFPLNETLMAPKLRHESTVHVDPIVGALVGATAILSELKLSSAAPPVFLLDADRRLAKVDPRPGRFDNRSVCFTTDFPSASFLLSHGIATVILVQEDTFIGNDLLQVLLEWQTGGISLLRKKARDSASPKSFRVKRPFFLRLLWYRISVAVGLRRSELGGFGGIVPSSG